MTVRRALWLALPIAFVVGCKDESGSSTLATATAEVKAPSATVAAAPPPTAAPARDHRRDHANRHRRGIVGMMLHAAHELDLKDAQKATLEKLAADLRGAGAPGAEMKEYHAALAAQLRAGKIDQAKLDPLQAAVDKAQKARQDKEAEALDGLHAALDPAQRKALVAAVRAKQPAHAPDPAKAADHAKNGLAHLTKSLDLGAAQQKKAEPLLAKEGPGPNPEDAKKRTDALLTAFEADAFDAKKLDLTGPPAGKAMAAHVQFLTGLLPVLKPEQREKLAAGLEKGRSFHGEHGAQGEEPAEEPAAP